TERTRVIDKTAELQATRTFTASYNATLDQLTINYNQAISRLALAVVNDPTNGPRLIIDAPDTTAFVVVASVIYEFRHWDWSWVPGWGGWHQHDDHPQRDEYRWVTFSNTQGFDLSDFPISKIVINGRSESETIVLD